jgi:hypothetical protein
LPYSTSADLLPFPFLAGLAPKLNQSNNIFATLLSMVGAIKQVRGMHNMVFSKEDINM